MDVLIAILLGLGSVGVVYAVYRSMSTASGRRAFARLPVTAAADITGPGPYRLTGQVIPIGQPPRSQASDRPYVARDLRIVESAGDSGSTRPARQIVDFLLDDGTGRVLVRADHASFTLARDFAAPRTTLDQVPWVDELLRAGGYHNGSPATCKIRIYEGVLAPGDRAGVIGHAAPADDHAASLGASHTISAESGSHLFIRAEGASPTQ